MVINIVKYKGEYWVLTEQSAEPFGNIVAASREAARLVYKADEVAVTNDYYDIFLAYLEEDEAEKPDWDFVPFGMMQFFTALADKEDVIRLASGDEERELYRSLAIGKEIYK